LPSDELGDLSRCHQTN